MPEGYADDLLICHALVDPRDEVFSALACAFGFAVTLTPHGFKVDVLNAVIVFEREARLTSVVSAVSLWLMPVRMRQYIATVEVP